MVSMIVLQGGEQRDVETVAVVRHRLDAEVCCTKPSRIVDDGMGSGGSHDRVG